MHVAAASGKEQELAAAYRALAAGRRLKQTSPDIAAEVLIHAAHYFQGMLGDVATAEQFLMSALAAAPTHLDAFERLEKKYEALPDKRRLLELYGKVGANPPKPAVELAGKAVNALVPMTAKTPLADDACKGLTGLGRASSSLLEALDAHCLKTGRAKLACSLIEHALQKSYLPEALAVDRRRRLVELYLNEGEQPEKAIGHVEILLQRDPNDPAARAATKRLVSIRALADRVSAMLQDLRRQGRQV
jgi:tetratricopeptide (TPR) repeat protein